ncbi:MAG: [protein-PII] uridylyltransferase [Polyangiaceae bacterium]|nr:[protein-PII] uridylyltransferase [Polyangiaceae bacterium]
MNPQTAESARNADPFFESLRCDFEASRAEISSGFLGELTKAVPALSKVDVPEIGARLGKQNAAAYDALLSRLWTEMYTRATDKAAWEGVLFAAVGSYGRGALALKSDIDVRLIASRPERATAVADALLYPLWDMGISVGHQVAAIDELLETARTDLPTATSLLDLRPIAGSVEAFDEIRRRCSSGLFAHSETPRFAERLTAEVTHRHERFGGSVYLLEPDVKNGAGGLRDFDVVYWALKARFGFGDLRELVRRVGIVVQREAEQIEAATEAHWCVRNILHARAGRRADRLTFDEQEAVAALLGYGSGPESIERMMSDYYRNARTISRALDMILSLVTPVLHRKKPREEDLGRGVMLFDEHVAMRDKELLRSDPALALRLVAAAVDRGVPLLPHTRDAIAGACTESAWCADLRADAEAAALFVSLVATPKETKLRAGSVVRELYDLGLLLAMIPEFSPVVGRTHHDMYHVYTVDVHSVAAVARLGALTRGELAQEHPLACRLAVEVTRPAMLFFATLLHDVGKAIGGTDHANRGADMAKPILERLRLAPEDVAEACHLIRKHLVMYHVATRRDVDDPLTVEEFSREVSASRETLRDLYLLTVADLSTTSPTSMTSWKARMLDELYLATDSSLGGEVTKDARVARAAVEVMEAIDALPSREAREREIRRSFVQSYLASMGDRYLLSNAPVAIAHHAEAVRAHESDLVSVSLVPSRHPGAAEVCVVAPDQPGLLAKITAAFAASRLEVHAAQIYSRKPTAGESRTTQAVDIFWVRDRGDGVSGVARSVPKLAADIVSLLTGAKDAVEMAHKRYQGGLRRATPKVRTQVTIDDRASKTHTVIEVFAEDRPGLLFAIAETLYALGLSIALAKINTEGTRVADVFYVGEGSDGQKVAPGPRTAEVRSRILAVLQGLSGDNEAPWAVR